MYEHDDDVNGYGVDYGQFDGTSGYCKHGVYTGGCGIDYMCGACEMGYDQWYPQKSYRSVIKIVYPNGYTQEHTGKTHYKREWAQEDLAYWMSTSKRAEYSMVTGRVQEQEGGYWDIRDRENEKTATVVDLVTDERYEVYWLFDHEKEELIRSIQSANIRAGTQRFSLNVFSTALSVQTVCRILDRQEF